MSPFPPRFVTICATQPIMSPAATRVANIAKVTNRPPSSRVSKARD